MLATLFSDGWTIKNIAIVSVAAYLALSLASPLGYSAPLPESVKSEMEKRGIAGSDLLDLMQTQQGRDLWREIGVTIDVAFDLRQGSKSWQVLEQYMSEKNIRPVEYDVKEISETRESEIMPTRAEGEVPRSEQPPVDFDEDAADRASEVLAKRWGLV